MESASPAKYRKAHLDVDDANLDDAFELGRQESGRTLRGLSFVCTGTTYRVVQSVLAEQNIYSTTGLSSQPGATLFHETSHVKQTY